MTSIVSTRTEKEEPAVAVAAVTVVAIAAVGADVVSYDFGL